MSIKKIQNQFPFRRLFNTLALLSFILQFIIISYNHTTGYAVVPSTGAFFLRWFIASGYTVIAALPVVYADLFIITKMNRLFPWNEQAIKRIPAELFFGIMTAVIISSAVTLLSHSIENYEQNLSRVFINNALIFTVVNIVIIAVLEALMFFKRSKHAEQKSEALKQELSQIKFELLKNQINPHFMFNSLNVLSSLISSKPDKAQDFIDEFSSLYRYILETIEKPVVSLQSELEFVRSYLFLQEMRYGKNLRSEIEIPASVLNHFIPPLSLQTVLENAVKHNIISDEQPLTIRIGCQNDHLLISNNLQTKQSSGYSSHLGQRNLSKRYEMISEQQPEFIMKNREYCVKLPLLKNDE
jgi:sensor histidine kinase YesM